MRNIKNCLLLFLLLFYEQVISCSIIFAECWKLNKKRAQPSACSKVQTVYLLSDRHKKHAFDSEQRKALLHFLRTKKETISFIAEDPNTFNDHKLSWEQMRKYTKKSSTLLRNSASLAHHCGILSTSVEFRPRTSIFNPHVCIEDIIRTTDEQVKQIDDYDDGSLLNQEYKNYIARYHSEITPSVAQLFKNIATQHCDINEIDYSILECPQETSVLMDLYESVSDVDPNNLKEYVGELITRYAQEAIDIKIVHTLAEHARKGAQTVVIYAGGAHFDSVKLILAKLGFSLFKYGRDHLKNNDINAPLRLSKVFEEFDPSYNPNTRLPKETIDYFFEYKEQEEERPSWINCTRMKMFVTTADAIRCYKEWKERYPTLHSTTQASLGVTVLALLCYMIKAYCE